MSLSDYLNRLRACLTSLSAQHRRAALRHLCRTDLFFLLRYGMDRADIEREWLFQRCREIQARRRVDDQYMANWFRYKPVSMQGPRKSARMVSHSQTASALDQ